MYYQLLTCCCLVLFFLFSLFHFLPCASSKQELGWCEARFQCGNITAGFPFSGGNRPQVCGHPLLELQCYNNTTSIIISNHFYNVLHINPTSNTLRLASAELLGSFCNATFTATALPTEIFELSQPYKSLTVFYLCDPKLPYRSSYTCPDRGLVSVVSQNLDYHDSCQGSFTINVPKSFVPEEKELDLKHLEKALREGFEVKVKIDEKSCQECPHGNCCFENTTHVCCKEASSSRFNLLHPPNAEEHHVRCSQSFTCGDQTDLFYPFWITGREECGHPEFQLQCNNSLAEVSISAVKFRILEANKNSRTIKLARSDYYNSPCPQNPINASFNVNVLPFASDTELLTVYYECPDFSTSISTYTGELDCDGEDGKRTYYVTRSLSSSLLNGITFLLNDFKSSCQRDVSIPASRPALDTLERTPSSDTQKKAFEDGFNVELNQECSKCMDSEGFCGFNKTLTSTSSGFVCYCIDKPYNNTCSSRKKESGLSTRVKAATGAGVTLFLFLVLTLVVKLLHGKKRKTSHDLGQQNHKALIPQPNLKAFISLKQYSYAQVKRMTKSFGEEVGRGGFGTVYKGTLSDGRKVAVKVLKDSKAGNYNGDDFINEVATMSQTSHVNIVTLLGFCSEGSKRAIIYEFMENGSLDKLISSNRSSDMQRKELYEIALGVARGLEYLHHGCRTRIVHFDIKPQNVLLDDNLCPKVSDFGLAKLCEKKQSILSLLNTRGTIGYIAPELFSRMYGRVSHKSDVYSYGMLVLEMIGARNKERFDQDSESNTSSMYFPEWIYKDIEKGDNGRLIENGISSEEDEIDKKMTLVGLWCIQSSPTDRPAMNRVIEMMEGSLDALQVPPRPISQIPAAPLQESSSTLSDDISCYTEVSSINAV